MDRNGLSLDVAPFHGHHRTTPLVAKGKTFGNYSYLLRPRLNKKTIPASQRLAEFNNSFCNQANNTEIRIIDRKVS